MEHIFTRLDPKTCDHPGEMRPSDYFVSIVDNAPLCLDTATRPISHFSRLISEWKMLNADSYAIFPGLGYWKR